METIVGIDFGTTNSEAAVCRNGRPVLVCDADGERVIPSFVFIDESEKCYVGRAAKNVALLYPQRTVGSVKRDLGTGRRYRIGDREYEPEEIASCIFAKLKAMVESHVGSDVRKAVVTVPAYYDDLRRQAIKRSAALADLEVVRLVNEPTAAALTYGMNSGEESTVLVYDLGGGTFDVSVLRVGGGVFQVLATRGDACLGGDDFDAALARLLQERFREETGIDLSRDRLAAQKILQEAERLKIQLSQASSALAEVPFIAANDQGPCHLSARIQRSEFEELIAGSIEKTLRLTRGTLQDAGLQPREVDRVLLSGGSTRIPAVSRAVTELFGKEIQGGANPEEVVACGAAIQAAMLSGQMGDTVLVDVTPLGLGVETADRKMVTLVPRNTVLPTRAAAVFTTVKDYQRVAQIRVLQGERPLARDNIVLGSFRLEGLERAATGQPNIEVSFDIDVEGIVHVSARDAATGSHREIELAGVSGLSDEAIGQIVSEARACELEDIYAVG